jgi:hypothetical protein
MLRGLPELAAGPRAMIGEGMTNSNKREVRVFFMIRIGSEWIARM